MFKAHKSWLDSQHSDWKLPDLNCMSTRLKSRQPECLPECMNQATCLFSPKMARPGTAVPQSEIRKTQQTNGAHGMLDCLPPHLQISDPNNTYPYINKKPSAFTCGFGGENLPNPVLGSCQKGLLIFDQSGDQTRFIYSSICPSVINPQSTGAKLVPSYGLIEEQAIKTDQFTQEKPAFGGELDGNHFYSEESEMHEDTEEINALLYSDEDDDFSDDDDDEVKSTGHSPVAIESNEDKNYFMEKVASSDCPNKRQKLIDGGYNKSSPVLTTCSIELGKPNDYESDAESSYVNGQTLGDEVGSNLAPMQSRKNKIHNTLRILESIIPGAKGKNTLLVLDEAIDYLQSLKLKAMALGV